MNILGTSADYQSTGCPFAARIRYVRLASNWALMNPARGSYVDTVGNCTDAVIWAAAAMGKTIMFDFANAPAWVLADPKNFIYNLGLFADHVAQRFAKAAPDAKFIFGVDNEFWITNRLNSATQAGTPVPPQTLAAFYYQMALTVFYSVTKYLPTSELNIIKAAGFSQAWDICRALQATNIGLLARWATLHRYSAGFDPLADVAVPANSQIVFGVPREMNFMRQWFPGCKVGYDELCNYAPDQTARLLTALIGSGADMAIIPTLCVANANAVMPAGFTQDSYGIDVNGVYKPMSLAIAEILGGGQ